MNKDEAFLYGVVLESGHIGNDIQLITNDKYVKQKLGEYTDVKDDSTHIIIEDDSLVEKLNISREDVKEELIPNVILGMYSASGKEKDNEVIFKTNHSDWLNSKLSERVGVEGDIVTGVKDQLVFTDKKADEVVDWICMNNDDCTKNVEVDFNADLREYENDELKRLHNTMKEEFDVDDKDKYLNLEDRLVDEFNRRSMEVNELKMLQAAESHTPDYTSTSTGEWNKPNLEDFSNDYFDEDGDPIWEDIDDHFLIARNGFPPEEYGELVAPVVSPDGVLHNSALQNAKARANQIEDVSQDVIDSAITTINNLAEKEFGKDWENSELENALNDSGIPFDAR